MWRNDCFSLNLTWNSNSSLRPQCTPALRCLCSSQLDLLHTCSTQWKTLLCLSRKKNFSKPHWQLAPLPLAMSKSKHTSRKYLKFLWYTYLCMSPGSYSTIPWKILWLSDANGAHFYNFSDFRSHKTPLNPHNWCCLTNQVWVVKNMGWFIFSLPKAINTMTSSSKVSVT